LSDMKCCHQVSLTSGSGHGTFSKMSLACWKCLLAAMYRSAEPGGGLYFFRSDISWRGQEGQSQRESRKNQRRLKKGNYLKQEGDGNVMRGKKGGGGKRFKGGRPHQQYLELDIVHRWGRDHAVEGSEAMLVANLLAVQLKLRLLHLPVHIQSHHRLRRDVEG